MAAFRTWLLVALLALMLLAAPFARADEGAKLSDLSAVDDDVPEPAPTKAAPAAAAGIPKDLEEAKALAAEYYKAAVDAAEPYLGQATQLAGEYYEKASSLFKDTLDTLKKRAKVEL